MQLGPYETPGYYLGDVLDCLRDLPDECINTVVTSPPYFGLRAYAGDQNVVWGGAPDCVHDWTEKERLTTSGGPPGKTAQVGATVAGVQRSKVQEATCTKCGAWKGGFGAEPTLELYVQHTVEILREIRRVLRSEGVCFWVIGDSYASQGGAADGGYDGGYDGGILALRPNVRGTRNRNRIRAGSGLKSKDLCLIPHRVALAVQADGWYVRSDIIWAKGASFGAYVGNPMPESVTDRCTRSHEYIWMFTKQPHYYWDQAAIMETAVGNPYGNVKRKKRPNPTGHVDGSIPWEGSQTRQARDVWCIPVSPFHGAHFAVFPPALAIHLIEAACPPAGLVLDPFAGSGTTLAVAECLGRDWLGFDISEEYGNLFAMRMEDVKKWFAKQPRTVPTT